MGQVLIAVTVGTPVQLLVQLGNSLSVGSDGASFNYWYSWDTGSIVDTVGE